MKKTATPQETHCAKQCFAPVVDTDTRLLILGSLPGDASLAQQQYYAHPQNRFWHLLSEVTGQDLRALAYETRLQTLRNAGIGLWDVVAKAHRSGSLDSQIRGHAENDVLSLISTLPQLNAIAFNGGTAAKIGMKALEEQASNWLIFTLPSSSPAYTLAYTKKLNAWLALRESLSALEKTNTQHPCASQAKNLPEGA